MNTIFRKFPAKGDRTIDQMVQAARSGKQNIIEGSAASATSSKTEIKLLKSKDHIRYNKESFIEEYKIPPIKIIDLKAKNPDFSFNDVAILFRNAYISSSFENPVGIPLKSSAFSEVMFESVG